MIKITNTLTGKKELFKPINSSNVTMYVCGITPYDFSHLGHGRCYVTFDFVYRLLTFLGYNVTYTRCFTDIDDKILVRAERELGDVHRYREISTRFINAYHEDMARLNCVRPTHEPRVTENIPQIIEFIDGLIKTGKAYAVNGDVYFHIPSFPAYGELSKQKIDDLRAGARVEVNDKKKDPLDFALWKSEPEGQFWHSPWGWGRPGWHIECSSFVNTCLGTTIDIHGGGMDLMFPHHENEIAQSEGLHDKPLANMWVHNAFVQINKEKMSKSLGNFFTLRDVFEKFDPMVIRYYMLNHQFKAPIDFAFDDVEALQKSYQKLVRVFESAPAIAQPTRADFEASAVVSKMLEFLCDYLNSPGMWGVVFENLAELSKNPQELALVKAFLQEVLGLTLQPLPEKVVEMTPEIAQLIAAREQARQEKNWKRADELRDQLKALGYEGQDKKV